MIWSSGSQDPTSVGLWHPMWRLELCGRLGIFYSVFFFFQRSNLSRKSFVYKLVQFRGRANWSTFNCLFIQFICSQSNISVDIGNANFFVILSFAGHFRLNFLVLWINETLAGSNVSVVFYNLVETVVLSLLLFLIQKF